jgi:polynucleotide 5'-kinase involved in rRNA processing
VRCKHRHQPGDSALWRLPLWLAEELYGTLLGFLDKAGNTVGIGILQRIDFAYHRLEVLTAEGIEGIRGVHWGRTRMGPNGDFHHELSTVGWPCYPVDRA